MARRMDESPISFPYDFRTEEEKEIDRHFEAFKDGLLDDCDCERCLWWRIQEREDLEDV